MRAHTRAMAGLTVGLLAAVLAAGLVGAETGVSPAAPAGGFPGGAGGPAEPTAAPAGAERVATLPVPVHCGTLQRVERVPGAVACVDLERVLADGNLDAGTGATEATRQRPPAPGMCFAVAVFSLARGRTLSKYDYRADAAGKAYECLGMATGEGPFDARRWKVETEGDARLLFELPADSATLHLVPALTTAVPMPAVRGVAFAAAPAAAPAAPVAAPAPTPAAEPAKPAAESAKPAAEPAKPAAEPAKPAAEPAKPAAEPAKPAAEPAKAAAAPAKPAAKRDALEF